MRKIDDFVFQFFLNESENFQKISNSKYKNEKIANEIYEQITDKFLLSEGFFPLKKTPSKLLNKAMFYHQKKYLSYSKKNPFFINTKQLTSFFNNPPDIELIFKNNSLKLLNNNFSSEKYEKHSLTYRDTQNYIQEEFIFQKKYIKIFILPKLDANTYNLRIQIIGDTKIKNISIYTMKKLIAAFTHQKEILLKNIPLKEYLIQINNENILLKISIEK